MAKKSSKRSNRSGRVSEQQQMWQDSEILQRGGFKPPDGEYDCRIEEAIRRESQAGNDMISWSLLLTSEEYEGRTVYHCHMLQTQMNFNYLRTDLAALNFSLPDDLNEIGEILEQAVDMEIRISVYNKDENCNISFVEPLEEDADSKKDKKSKKSKKSSKKKGVEKEPELTAKDVNKMSEDELSELAKENGLDPDDYDTWPLLAEDLIETLALD